MSTARAISLRAWSRECRCGAAWSLATKYTENYKLYAILATWCGNWGRRPRDWAELAEPSNQPLFAEVLGRVGLRDGSRLLDIGCGSGYAARMAAALGAPVTGLDITPELLAIARERVPAGDFRLGDMAALPFVDGSFDAVVGFNAFPFADDPVAAVAEGRRVLRAGGLLGATTFAEPERNQSTALHLALEPLRDRRPTGPPAVWALVTRRSRAPGHPGRPRAHRERRSPAGLGS